MMRPYEELPQLSGLYLEDSYVLDIEAHPGRVEFRMEFVLTPDHPDYHPPGPREQHCVRRGRLVFQGVKHSVWSGQGAPPARDASGEFDYGNIDSFEWDSTDYVLEGSWGNAELVAGGVDVELAPAEATVVASS